MNIEDLTYRSDTVGRIDIPPVSLIIFESPIVVILLPERIQIVDIAAFNMYDLAKEPMLSHI
jgi:hypothetical protein